MQVTLLKAKLHRARVTHTYPQGEGTLAIDGDLLDLAGIHEHEYVQVYNADSGEHLNSYVVRAEYGSRTVSVNGNVAQRIVVGDRLIIYAFSSLSIREASGFQPIFVFCDDNNNVADALNAVPMQMVC